MKGIICGTLFVLISNLSVMAQNGHYLFAYFNNNTKEGQQVCYAVSDDGVHFSPLNDGLPVISSDTIALSGGVRDPHLLRGQDGWFYQVLTDMDMSKGKWSNRGIILLRSHDLIQWEHHCVHFPARYPGKPYAQANAVWAPQTIYDFATEKLMVYFSLHSDKEGPFPQDAVYYAYANADFSDLEGDPQLLFAFPHPTIDTDIVQDNAAPPLQGRGVATPYSVSQQHRSKYLLCGLSCSSVGFSLVFLFILIYITSKCRRALRMPLSSTDVVT